MDDLERLLKTDFSAESRVRAALKARLVAAPRRRPSAAPVLAVLAIVLFFPHGASRRMPVENGVDRLAPIMPAARPIDPNWRAYENFAPEWRDAVIREGN